MPGLTLEMYPVDCYRDRQAESWQMPCAKTNHWTNQTPSYKAYSATTNIRALRVLNIVCSISFQHPRHQHSHLSVTMMEIKRKFVPGSGAPPPLSRVRECIASHHTGYSMTGKRWLERQVYTRGQSNILPLIML